MEIKVLILDDEQEYIDRFVEVCSEFPEVKVVGARVTDVLASLDAIQLESLQVLLLDHELTLGGNEGLEIAHWIDANRPETTVISTTRPDHHGFIRAQKIYKGVKCVKHFIGKNPEALRRVLCEVIIRHFAPGRNENPKVLYILKSQSLGLSLKKVMKTVFGISSMQVCGHGEEGAYLGQGFDTICVGDTCISHEVPGTETLTQLFPKLYELGLAGKVQVLRTGCDKEEEVDDPSYFCEFVRGIHEWAEFFKEGRR